LQWRRKQCGAGAVDRLQRLFGLAVHQVDEGKIRRNLSLGRTFETILCLILQELRRLLQKVNLDEASDQPPDHHVAVRAERRKFLEVQEEGQRLDRLEPIGHAIHEKSPEGLVQVRL
jgi:hypothetical protein